MFFLALHFWTAIAIRPMPVAVVDTTALVQAVLATHGGDPKYLAPVADAVVDYATQLSVDPLLIAGVITVENPDLIPTARNPSGAVGIMQVMPFWKADLPGCGRSLKEIRSNVCYGTKILALHLKDRTPTEALYRYNGCRTVTRRCREYARTVIRRAHGVRARRLTATH